MTANAAFTTEADILKDYEKLIEGVATNNRTDIKATNEFCKSYHFDLRGGHVPLMTTKFVNMAAVLAELQWFIMGSTDNKCLNKLGTKIWNEWAAPNGSLGPIYGAMWRRRPISLAAVGRRISIDKLKERYHFYEQNSVEVELHELTRINELNTDIDALKREYPGLYKTWLDMLSFCSSRYLEYLAGEKMFVNLKIEDEQERSSILKKLKEGVVGEIEVNMYGSISPSNICTDWLSFADFVQDAGLIAYNESVDRKKFVRISSYLSGTRVYSPYTTVFMVPIVVHVINEFIKGLTPEEQANYRPVLFIDQLSDLIDNIKTNPGSRRLLVSSWEPSLAPDERDVPSTNPQKGLQALTPCHHEFQVVMQPQSVNELIDRLPNRDMAEAAWDALAAGEPLWALFDQEEASTDHEALCIVLSDALPRFMPYNLQLRFSMRSSDVFLGLPFNIASYGALAHWLAMMTGSSATDLVYQGTSFHMYANTAAQASVQVQRTPGNAPSIQIPYCEHISQFHASEVVVNDYEHAGKLTAAVAV